MKHVWIPLIVVFLFSCEKKKHGNVLASESSHKKIKEIVESIHDPISDDRQISHKDAISENSFVTNSVFNRKGLLTVEKKFNGRGKLDSKMIWRYDEKDRVIECKKFQPEEVPFHKQINEYNSQGQLIETSEFDTDGKCVSKTKAHFDLNGNRILTIYQGGSNGFAKTEERIFDATENNTDNYTFSGEAVESQVSHQYNEQGKVIETVQRFPSKNEQTITRYEYDAQNHQIGLVVLKNNMVTTKIKFRYDSHRNLEESFTYGMSGNLQSREKREYEYDAEGNWTKQIVFANKKPASVILRQIVYY